VKCRSSDALSCIASPSGWAPLVASNKCPAPRQSSWLDKGMQIGLSQVVPDNRAGQVGGREAKRAKMRLSTPCCSFFPHWELAAELRTHPRKPSNYSDYNPERGSFTLKLTFGWAKLKLDAYPRKRRRSFLLLKCDIGRHPGRQFIYGDWHPRTVGENGRRERPGPARNPLPDIRSCRGAVCIANRSTRES
jgi:hypothetical protein